MGTTIRHTDQSQLIVNTYEYDAWGQPFVVSEGGSTKQQYRFTGKELDPDSIPFNSANGRYHFPARFYVVVRGIFAQRDPLYVPPLFAYVDQSPTWLVDADGLLGRHPIEKLADFGGGGSNAEMMQMAQELRARTSQAIARLMGSSPAPVPPPSPPPMNPQPSPPVPQPGPSLMPMPTPVPTGGPKPGPGYPPSPGGDPELPPPGPPGGESPLKKEMEKCKSKVCCCHYAYGDPMIHKPEFPDYGENVIDPTGKCHLDCCEDPKIILGFKYELWLVVPGPCIFKGDNPLYGDLLRIPKKS